MDGADVARSRIKMFPIRRRQVFEQFDPVSGRRLENSQFDFGPWQPGDLRRQVAGLVRAMRQLEAENILPESQRALQIQNRNPGVIRGENAKRHVGENVERPTPNVQSRIGKPKASYPTAAMTFSSIAIGVGSAMTSIVVRVGFGLPSPAKYSA